MSIKKIAEKAGVSYVTVSRALNHPEQVSPETCAKIQKLFKDMNFKPRVIPNRLDTVNFLLPSPEYLTPHDGISFTHTATCLAQKGYHTVISPMHPKSIQNLFHTAYIAILKEGDSKVESFIREHCSDIPFIVISDTSRSLPDNVLIAGSDHRHGTTLAIEYLLNKGHTRIGYVGNNLTSRGYREKFEAYSKLMRRHSSHDEDFVFLNDEKLLFEGLQRLCGKKITALFIAEEDLTLKTIYYLDLLGKKVPQDISVVSKETAGGSEFLYPPITCIIQPLKKLSILVADLAHKCTTDGSKSVPRCTYIPYDFIERESVMRIK